MPRSAFLRAVSGLALAATAGLLPACASGGGASSAGRGGPAGAPQRAGNRNVLTRADLEAFGSTNLLDAVTALRPRWLENTRVGSMPRPGGRGFGNTAGVAVYVNGQRYGDVGTLSSVPKDHVERITFLSIAEAQQRYSMDQLQPILDVRLRSSGG